MPTTSFNLAEIDCIFISYDEPNAEKNYADLLNKAPWAKRVHGIKGSDAAHKAAASLSDTDRFITVDADNIVDPNFFNLTLEENGNQFSWCGKNNINGLAYGNGGLKCWTKDFVLNMKTHEAAEDINSQVDFCWHKNYQQMANLYSISHINTTPLQAWRAGFREGVKMTLKDGVKQTLVDPKKQIVRRNYQRLLIWCSVGADIDNGIWAVLGAREGAYKTNCSDWDYTSVRDFDWLNNYWNEQGYGPASDVNYRLRWLGEELRSNLNLSVAELDHTQSKFFKEVWTNPPRFDSMIKELDTNWDLLDL